MVHAHVHGLVGKIHSKMITHHTCIRPNKKISVFRVTGLKILGRVGTQVFFKLNWGGGVIILCILKGISPFKMHNIIIVSRKPEKNYSFHQ